MNDSENTQAKSLAISLSGGGHRATLFALGALMYLVDAKANAVVSSIASVSGGSLTNGFVGQTVDFRQTGSEDFRRRVAAPLATQIANKGTLFAPFSSKLYVAVLVIFGLAVLVIPMILAAPWYLRLLTFLIGITLWGWFAGKRGAVCAAAFRKTLFSPGGRETRLADLKKDGLDHVICSTEFRSSEQVYFAGDFIYSYALGHGKPADMSLAHAVQSSAAYPGGFPPATLPAKSHSFSGAPSIPGGPSKPPDYMVLTDGGVYDNMGDQWARGFAKRLALWPDLGHQRRPPTQLVVVNASARVPWSPFRRRLIPLIGEVLALLRVMDIMFINTTNVRRQVIFDSYNPADPEKVSGLPQCAGADCAESVCGAERVCQGSCSRGPTCKGRALVSKPGAVGPGVGADCNSEFGRCHDAQQAGSGGERATDLPGLRGHNVQSARVFRRRFPPFQRRTRDRKVSPVNFLTQIFPHLHDTNRRGLSLSEVKCIDLKEKRENGREQGRRQTVHCGCNADGRSSGNRWLQF